MVGIWHPSVLSISRRLSCKTSQSTIRVTSHPIATATSSRFSQCLWKKRISGIQQSFQIPSYSLRQTIWPVTFACSIIAEDKEGGVSETLIGKTDRSSGGLSIAQQQSTTEDPDSPPGWTIKLLYDGECPLCMREVDMLRERNKTHGKIKFVDISSEVYSAGENSGVDFETAMGRIHAILRDGTILTNVAAFKRLYEEVGLGWVYAITNYEPFAIIADYLYSFWAKYRLQITGRPPLIQILELKRRKQRTCRTE